MRAARCSWPTEHNGVSQPVYENARLRRNELCRWVDDVDALRRGDRMAGKHRHQPTALQFRSREPVGDHRDTYTSYGSLDQAGCIVGDERTGDADRDRLAVITEMPDRMGREPRKPDATVIGKVGGMRRHAPLGQIVWRSTQQATGRGQLTDYQAAIGEFTDPHGDVESFRNEINIAILVACLDGKAGMLPQECRQDRRDPHPPESRRKGQAQRAPHRARSINRFRIDFANRLNGFPHPLIIGFAGFGQGDPTCRSLQKSHTKPLLKRRDPSRDERPIPVQCGPGGGEPRMLYRGEKGRDLVEIRSVHCCTLCRSNLTILAIIDSFLANYHRGKLSALPLPPFSRALRRGETEFDMDAASISTVADNRYKVLVAICISAVIIPLVFTGPAISIPSVARDLGGDQASLGWIVNAYAIAFGGCVMAAGALGDQIGRKRCFVTGLVIFAITSVLIGLTPSLLVLNLLRALEGIGGALVLTSATSLLAQEFEGVERTRAFSFLGTAFGVGLAFGPMASGFVIEHWGWRALYFAIAVISILILVLGTPRIRESRDPDAQGIDWPGTILFTAALVGLTFAIVLGPQQGWTSATVLGLLGAAIVLLAAFAAVELKRAHPMLDLSLFRYPRFIGVQLLPVATGFSFVALIVYLPIWFMAVQGRDAFAAGLAILPLTAPMLVVPLIAGRLARFVSPGILSGLGFLIAAAGALLLMRLSPEAGLGPMILPMLLIGIGNGLPWGLMDALSVSVVPKERAGMAAGIFTTMRVAGEAIAIAAIGAALVGLTALGLTVAAADSVISLPASSSAIASTISSGAHGVATNGGPALDGTIMALANVAYTDAFRAILFVLAMLAILTALICLLTLRDKPTDVPATDV